MVSVNDKVTNGSRLLLFLLFFPIVAFASVPYDSIKILVNDYAITSNEIELRLVEIAKQRNIRLKSTEKLDAMRKAAIDLLIEEALLEIRADELNITIGDNELDEEIDFFRKQRNLSQVEFEELLERRGIGLSDFRKMFQRQLKRKRVILKEVQSKIRIDEEELKAEYERRSDSIQLVHARHILLRVKSGSSSQEEVQVRNRLSELKKRIESGESFESIADRYSEDPSVTRNHGDLGFFKKQDMVSAFSEAAFALPVGKVSDLIRTPFGFHLIEVLGKKRESKEPFSKVKNRLYQERYRLYFKKNYKEFNEKLRKQAKIVYR